MTEQPSYAQTIAAEKIDGAALTLRMSILAYCPVGKDAEALAQRAQQLGAEAVQLLLKGAAVVLLCTAAHAAPPPNPDPALAPWFESLTRPDTGTGCCSAADCRPVASRIDGDHYEVWIGAAMFGKEAPDDWVKVPPEKILQRHDNPVGEPVACWMPQLGILCFIRGPET